MDDRKLEALLDAYGADVEKWPAQHRAAGRARLAERGEDRRLAEDVRAAAALDALLGARPRVEVPGDLVGRIMAQAPSAETRRAWAWAGGAIAVDDLLGFRGPTLAASLLLLSLGVLAGWSASRSVAGSAAGDALLSAVYDGPTDDLFTVEGL